MSEVVKGLQTCFLAVSRFMTSIVSAYAYVCVCVCVSVTDGHTHGHAETYNQHDGQTDRERQVRGHVTRPPNDDDVIEELTSRTFTSFSVMRVYGIGDVRYVQTGTYVYAYR